MGLAKAVIQPPSRLRALPDRWVRVLRPLWMLLFGFAILADVSATFYVLRDIYEVQPVFYQRGLDYEVQYRGEVWVGTIPDANGNQAVPTRARLVRIGNEPIDPEARVSEIASRLQQAAEPITAIDLRQPDGRIVHLRQRLVEPKIDPVAVQQRDLRVAARLLTALVACVTLLACSLLLALRRPHDPVAMLFAFAFAALAATIDPPLQMWMGLGMSPLSDVVSSLWFYLLLIGFATFPDGIFVPRVYRWLLVLGVAFAVFVSLPNVDEDLQVFTGLALLLAMLVGQVRRYRRLRTGIERQQMKWAAFGFVAGLLLLTAAFTLAASIPENLEQQNPWTNLTVLILFSLGMAALPLGLLIALTRFRLWEADTVITRSAAYAVVTVVVGVVWAASTDLVKLVIEEVIGRESPAGATTVGAVIAAGIFSPTQSVVLGWTRRRFGGPLDRIRDAAKRLKSWGLTEPPGEVATRALAIIDEAVHPSASAIVLDTAMSRELIAARDAASADDPRLIDKIVLADEESSVGTLLLGRRSDGNRYSRQELQAVQEIVPALAEALRVARSRYSRENLMQQRLDEMAARLAQLEGGTPNTA
jgi:hypothetical protein